MRTNALSRRYAKALLSIGLADRNADLYGKQLGAASQALAPSMSALRSPALSRDAKKKIIGEAAQSLSLAPAVASLMKLLVDKGRLRELAVIAQAYLELSDEAAGRIHGQVTSAVPLDEATLAQLRVKLTKRLGKNVSLEPGVDAALMGGLRAQVGSLVIDGSLAGQLERFERLIRKE